jgi:hypothetical protein
MRGKMGHISTHQFDFLAYLWYNRYMKIKKIFKLKLKRGVIYESKCI